MIRTVLYFGLWATLCMALAITALFVAFGGIPRTVDDVRQTIPIITFFAVFSPVAGIVAGPGWLLLHRKVSRPTWWGYALLALGIVVVSHVLVFGGLNIGWWWPDLPDWAGMMAIIFVMHGWLSVPVALAGTALFVLWDRRGGQLAQS